MKVKVTTVGSSAGVVLPKVSLSTRLVEDVGLDGDDFEELIERFGEQFSVDMGGYRWYHHHGPEGCNPLWLFVRPWWWRKTSTPVSVAVLVESARQKK